MTGKGYKQLKIDNDFKNLIRPLRRDEHAQLEANIILDGCRDPIIAWKGIIIDGHNRYEICNRLHIPYTVQEIEFNGREEAVIWICVNQLGRRSITEETRKYLIGRQYEAEKIIGFRRNANGHNQYTKSTDSDLPDISDKTNDTESKESSRRTANRIGSKYNISSGSVQKYAIYSNAIDTLGKKMPELVPKVLSGNYKISHENIVALSKMGAKEAKELNTKIRQGTAPFTRYSESRRDLPGS